MVHSFYCTCILTGSQWNCRKAGVTCSLIVNAECMSTDTARLNPTQLNRSLLTAGWLTLAPTVTVCSLLHAGELSEAGTLVKPREFRFVIVEL